MGWAWTWYLKIFGFILTFSLFSRVIIQNFCYRIESGFFLIEHGVLLEKILTWFLFFI